MRILEIETFGRGGLTHYVFNLARALAARGHAVEFVTTAAYELEGRGLGAEEKGIRVWKALARWSPRLSGSMPGFVMSLVRKVEAIADGFTLLRTVRRLKPDLVHVHCTNPVVLLYLALLRLAGRPVVATAHVVTPHEPIPLQAWIYRWVHRLPDLVIAHSEVDRARLVDEFGVAVERTRMIPHGEYSFFEAGVDVPERADARAPLELADDAEVALFFGYVREYKGLDVLLEAWPLVVRERPRARLVVAGDPVQLPPARLAELRDRATELDAIQRLGYIPFEDVPGYFAAADALVMPYRRISQSGVLFLALSVGVPVVATRVGALPEMLTDGEDALLVPPESPAELAGALVRLFSDRDLHRRLAAGGRAVAADHSWESIAERSEAEFAALVGGGTGA